MNCPFKAGDYVTYKPTDRGRDMVVMTDLRTLVPGARYRIARIERGEYVVIEGFESIAGGGLYWTEFGRAE